jgi:hypothetical protein
MLISVGRAVQRGAARWAVAALIVLGLAGSVIHPAAGEDTPQANCRYGIVSAGSPQGYPIDSLGVSGYLDGLPDGWPSHPTGVEYVPVLRLRDLADPPNQVSSWVAAHPGATWLVGDEPDNPGRDNLTAEGYAARYFVLANQIRAQDPSARLGFGSISQPSPIRMRYLAHAWDELIRLAGSRQSASALVDIWNIHAFYLDEVAGTVDAGIPPGFENDAGDAYGHVMPEGMYFPSLFISRLLSFRSWISDQGEREKPLWISSYGVWLNHDLIQDSMTSKFMTTTIAYLENAADTTTGLSVDDNRLVQRWFWYSLNGSLSTHSGSLYDPDQSAEQSLTQVGVKFLKYTNGVASREDLRVAGIGVKTLNFHGPHALADAQVSVTVANAGNRGLGTDARVSLWEGDPQAGGKQLAATALPTSLPGCGAVETVAFLWKDVQPFRVHSLFAQVDMLPDPVAELNRDNNRKPLDVAFDAPTYLPFVNR